MRFRDRLRQQSRAALGDAAHHAAACRALDPYGAEVTEIARDITTDVRAELPRIDARAGAGIALSAAILIGTVQQTPTVMPLFAFGVAAAVLLTVSLLLFLAVLLPPPAKESRTISLRWGRFLNGEELVSELSAWNRAVYHATVAIDLSHVVQAKYRRLTLALWAGVLAVLTLALGVSWDLLSFAASRTG